MDRWDAELSVQCPLYECSQTAGVMCVYVTAPAGCGHELGQETRVPHRERRKIGRIIRHHRAEQLRIELLATQALRAQATATRDTANRLMVLGRNPDERTAMRRWLAEYGPVLWQDPGR
jgi:hypothetical protein